MVETFENQHNEPTNKISMKVPKVLKKINKKTFGTSVIKSVPFPQVKLGKVFKNLPKNKNNLHNRQWSEGNLNIGLGISTDDGYLLISIYF